MVKFRIIIRIEWLLFLIYIIFCIYWEERDICVIVDDDIFNVLEVFFDVGCLIELFKIWINNNVDKYLFMI